MTDRIEQLAQLLVRARLDLRPIEAFPSDLLPQSWADARKIADLTMDGAEPAGWKLGGTTQPSRHIFGLKRPFYGPYKAGEVHQGGSHIDVSGLISPLVEAEVVITFRTEFPPDPQPRNVSELSKHLAWIAPALEIPSTPLTDVLGLGIKALVADRSAAGVLAIGKQHDPAELDAISNQTLDLVIDGKTVSSSNVSALIDGVLGAARDFLVELGREGRTLPAGVPIATGGLTPASPIDGARQISAVFEGWDRLDLTLA